MQQVYKPGQRAAVSDSSAIRQRARRAAFRPDDVWLAAALTQPRQIEMPPSPKQSAPPASVPPGASSLYSIGHSRHSAEHFVSLLRAVQITLLVDVRSQPVSRWAPHFTRPVLEQLLLGHGIGYVFLGRELGGRPSGAQYYTAAGEVDYALRARSGEFQAGIAQLVTLARRQRAVMLCAEENPEWCHRRRLIAPALASAAVGVLHLRGDGRLQAEAESHAAPAQLGLFR